MKNLKNLSIMMSTLIIVQAGLNPSVFAGKFDVAQVSPNLSEADFDRIGSALKITIFSKDINYANYYDDGRTLLHIAAGRNALQIAELLISKGADINAKDIWGNTPLHSAAKKDASKVAELLTNKGADINAKNDAGATPLHYAATFNAGKVVELLISKGSDINAEDKDRETPLDIAMIAGHDKIAELLILEKVGTTNDMKRRVKKYLLQSEVFRPDLEDEINEALMYLEKEEAPEEEEVPEEEEEVSEEEKEAPEEEEVPEEEEEVSEEEEEVSEEEKEAPEEEEVPEEEEEVSEEEKENNRQKEIKKIIKEDNLELLQKEVEKNSFMNTKIKGSFFDEEYANIPILHYCVMKRARKCFKFLLLNGADPSKTIENRDMSASFSYGWDCMSVAICFGEWEMMKILEERGINKFNNPNVWEAAALTHRNDLLKLFISNKDQIDNSVFEECLNKAVFGAVKVNNIKGLILLLKQGVDVNAYGKEGKTLLHIAAENGAVKVVDLLIKKGARINAEEDAWRHFTPICIAAKNNEVGVVDLLIKNGAKVNWNGLSPIHIAAENGAVKVVDLLIKKGANINVEDRNKTTLLYTALKADPTIERNKIVQLLILKGADINAKDLWGETPLHIAVKRGEEVLAKQLIIRGADVNAKGRYLDPVIFYAVENCSEKFVRFLLNCNVDTNVRSADGKTLEEAVREKFCRSSWSNLFKLCKEKGIK